MTTISDLDGIEVEHLLGAASGPLVKIRCLSAGVILLGQVDPASARQIAMHLFESAARAEYEADFHVTATAGGLDDQTIGMIMHMIRAGEVNRHTGDTNGNDA